MGEPAVRYDDPGRTRLIERGEHRVELAAGRPGQRRRSSCEPSTAAEATSDRAAGVQAGEPATHRVAYTVRKCTVGGFGEHTAQLADEKRVAAERRTPGATDPGTAQPVTWLSCSATSGSLSPPRCRRITISSRVNAATRSAAAAYRMSQYPG